MNTFIEPTTAEIKGLFDHSYGGRDLPWAELLARVEAKFVAAIDGCRRGGTLPEGDSTDEDFQNLVRLLVREGRARRLPEVSRRSLRQAFYVACRLDGSTHALADMVAHKTPPMSNSDREFLEGHCNGNQFDGAELVGNWYAKQARKAGVSIKGKIYINGLAAYPGDPRAWVSDKNEAAAVLRERNWSCEGAMKVKGHAEEGPPDVRVADDLVESRMMDRLESEPHLALKGHEALFHETRESMQPHWTD